MTAETPSEIIQEAFFQLENGDLAEERARLLVEALKRHGYVIARVEIAP